MALVLQRSADGTIIRLSNNKISAGCCAEADCNSSCTCPCSSCVLPSPSCTGCIPNSFEVLFSGIDSCSACFPIGSSPFSINITDFFGLNDQIHCLQYYSNITAWQRTPLNAITYELYDGASCSGVSLGTFSVSCCIRILSGELEVFWDDFSGVSATRFHIFSTNIGDVCASSQTVSNSISSCLYDPSPSDNNTYISILGSASIVPCCSN